MDAKAKGVLAGGSMVALGMLIAPTAFSQTSNVTVGTSFTRDPTTYTCFSTCTYDWNHQLLDNCGKTASARIRFERDFLPDETVRSHDDYTGCDVWGWTFTAEGGRPHHYDGKVTSGNATMAFSVK